MNVGLNHFLNHYILLMISITEFLIMHRNLGGSAVILDCYLILILTTPLTGDQNTERNVMIHSTVEISSKTGRKWNVLNSKAK